MGFLKRLFEKKATATVQLAVPQNNTIQAKTAEDEYNDKVLQWGRINDIPDVRERIRKMEEMAYSGFDVAYLSLSDYYMELADITGEIQWDKVNYWLEKACEADMPNGHFYMALSRSNSANPHCDLDRAIEEFCIAASMGVEAAIQKIAWYCTPRDEADPKSVELAEAHIDLFAEELEPFVEELLEKGDKGSWNALGLMYFYGVYYERDFDKAKECFIKAENRKMLENPVFEEDDEDED